MEGKGIATGFRAFDHSVDRGRAEPPAFAIKGRFTMLRFPILALTLIFSAPSAHAEMLPAYDSEAICSDIAGTSAKQELIMRGCLDFQERIRKEVALTWETLPAPVQESCGKAAEASGDYWRLKSCIDKATESAAGR
jgi:hypothetical protein